MKLTDTKPMMSDQEIRFIDNILKERKPKYCLEWGSGNSTTYFPRHRFIKSWLAVEHDGNILDQLKPRLPNNVQTVWILPGDSYADCVQRSHIKYDFILIDGLDRQKCLENALKIISKDGIILLHDAGRMEYQGFISAYGGIIVSEGEKPQKGGGFAHRGLAVFHATS